MKSVVLTPVGVYSWSDFPGQSPADPEGNFFFNLFWHSLVDFYLNNFWHVLTFLYLLLFTFLLIPGIKNSHMLNKFLRILH